VRVIASFFFLKIQNDMIKISDTEYFSNDRTIRFLNMDCNEFMSGCKDKEFDLNLSDPPYGIGMSNSNKRTKPSRPNSYTKYADFRYKDANWDDEVPDRNVFDNIFRTSINQIIWGANYLCDFMPKGFGWIFWNKLNGLNNCFSDGEFAFSSKGVQSRYFELSTFHNLNGGKDRIHPTEKPIELYKWLIDNYTKPTDTILDCFGGSMSNAIACHIKRRKLTIIELDVDYFKSALNRFEIYERQVEDIKEFGYAKTKINAQNPVLF